ncbi:MAG TPA: hypothetical protein VM187_15965 [Niastella sp.]|nr:hypothetical protein [Niastella sp.]
MPHQVKCNVDFDNCDVTDIKDKIQQLKENIRNGNYNNKKVGYNPTRKHVEHVEYLFNAIKRKYTKLFPYKPHDGLKLYHVKQQLRSAVTPTTVQAAKEVLNEIVKPSQPRKRTRKQQIEVDVKTNRDQWTLDIIRKQGGKNLDNNKFPYEPLLNFRAKTVLKHLIMIQF